MKFIVVKTTFEKKEEAFQMARLLLDKRLVSCVQISEIYSLYRWKGKVENEHEFIVTMKTKKKLYKEVEKTIKENHSYETPQIIAIPICKGSVEYLKWIEEETK